MIIIDGAYGEGGGQVLRTSLTLSMLTGQTVQIQNIRAGRPQPGLAAQHLTAVRAAAAICAANLSGDEMGSQQVCFRPERPPQAGAYTFDVAQIRGSGSAGSVSLVLQTVLLPLALASGSSKLTLRGGTHVAWSPSFSYIKDVYLPALARLGIQANIELAEWGFYPAGGGELVAHIPGNCVQVRAMSLTERGALERAWGTAVAANLSAHIPQRMANRAQNLLSHFRADVQARRVRAQGPGVGIFLTAEYSGGVRAGFSAYGRKGLPAERVAKAACQDLIRHHHSGAPVDMHLADQLIVPLSSADGPSHLTCCATEHLRTNMWVVEQFAQAKFEIGPTPHRDTSGEREKTGKMDRGGTTQIITIIPRQS